MNPLQTLTFSEPLPDTLSGLLRLAVHDAQAAEKAGHVLEMGLWVQESIEEPICRVCMAGAVMLLRGANTLAVLQAQPWSDELSPDDVADQVIRSKLLAINAMREGRFSYAADKACDRALPVSLAGACYRAVSNNYIRDLQRAPWPVYEQIANWLESEGF